MSTKQLEVIINKLDKNNYSEDFKDLKDILNEQLSVQNQQLEVQLAILAGSVDRLPQIIDFEIIHPMNGEEQAEPQINLTWLQGSYTIVSTELLVHCEFIPSGREVIPDQIYTDEVPPYIENKMLIPSYDWTYYYMDITFTITYDDNGVEKEIEENIKYIPSSFTNQTVHITDGVIDKVIQPGKTTLWLDDKSIEWSSEPDPSKTYELHYTKGEYVYSISNITYDDTSKEFEQVQIGPNRPVFRMVWSDGQVNVSFNRSAQHQIGTLCKRTQSGDGWDVQVHSDLILTEVTTRSEEEKEK